VLKIERRPQQLNLEKKMLSQLKDMGNTKKDAQKMFLTSARQKERELN